jgi:3'-phosphoadenosine 5'-phosphosulfate sulfotransferase (PAPS reductase)/FAD synthetase
MDSSEFYLEDLKSKFMKINPSDYYLSYSGGRDSHFLFWFIKEYLHDYKIEIVGINTGLEFKEIADRMKNNSDRILKPTKTYFEIKEDYGIPCFSKIQDQLIYEYQKHIAEDKEIPPYLKERINNDDGKVSYYRLNSVAREALFSGKLHKVSHLCCKYMKKNPARKYEEESMKKPIIGMMQSESVQRKSKIRSCFNKKGYFYPIFDLSNEIQSKVENKYGIEVPDIYKYVSQTGCVGCPYGISHGETIKELSLCTPQQRKFVLDYFKESYEVRGLFYQYKFNF